MNALGTACVWLIVFSLTYVSTAMFALPVPTLDPRDGSWALMRAADPAQMRYYGQILVALVASVIVAVPYDRLTRNRAVATSTLLPLWAATSIVLCLSYYAWHNWP